ncbi:pyruvate, phosphate dikinase [Bifidobacterium sp. ESL0825]|uniref:pyruvate, phosphate dikinase n=1 Tax=Bifidobacterium sp. ESL0825 TaxID=3448587 RepID=UPI004041E3F6
MRNTTEQFVYKLSEGDASMRDLLGGKGAGVAEMTKLGMPVPEGFTITTQACRSYLSGSNDISQEIHEQVLSSLSDLEKATGKRLGDGVNPLLVSVRSGAQVSMPGMMDTILNLGLNEEVVQALISKTDNPRWAWDSYRRFIQMYSNVVMGFPEEVFEQRISERKTGRQVSSDNDLDAEDMEWLARRFLDDYKQQEGHKFPTDPTIQLFESIKAVFRSWNNPRAVYFRQINGIPDDLGTAVTVQRMVFGNLSQDSGTGVAFSRNPITGEKGLFGEYLMNAQGEDVVAGIRTPEPLSTLSERSPEIYQTFVNIAHKLELHYRDMQDMEFTIEEGRLYMLQTRNGKRAPQAAFQIASDLVDEGVLTQEDAVSSIDPLQVSALLHPRFDPAALQTGKELGTGLPASPGAATGRVVFSAEAAQAWSRRGEQVILVRRDTTPEDIVGMHRAEGILTSRGGMTSHAAVVARGIGRCCVSGLSRLEFTDDGRCRLANHDIKEGDWISLDGETGKVYAGKLTTLPSCETGPFARVMSWADRFRRMEVRANADTPEDARRSQELGAEGIGLCRTEHMFFQPDRIEAIRRMIVAADEEERQEALDALLPMQREDFTAMYEALGGRPMTVRLIDPPLHEFLPKTAQAVEALAKATGHTAEEIKDTADELTEVNPMLGHRGSRLAVTYPAIARMQTRAVVEAAIQVKHQHPDWSLAPEIMVPLVSEPAEFEYVKQIVEETANQVIRESGLPMYCSVGTMIETPRAALLAGDIAAGAEFFSFGTNDLTQMTFGLSRDDAGSFLQDYYDKGLLQEDPFSHLDQAGVGRLVEMAVKYGKRTRPNLKVGICGEHGGDPSSIEFCERIGLDYVSCSTYRVPVARLAAAQASLGRHAPERR